MKKYLRLAFLIVATLTVCEFIFIRGLFTWLIAMGTTIILGSINILLSLIEKDIYEAYLYFLCTLAISMAYLSLTP